MLRRTVRISDTISQVQFSNPHVRFALDVKNPDGTATRWNVESSAPNPLIRGGVTRDALKEGTAVIIGADNCAGPNCIRIEGQPSAQK